MASKNKAKNNQPNHTTVKYVKKALRWVKTVCLDGKFTQSWTEDKPE